MDVEHQKIDSSSLPDLLDHEDEVSTIIDKSFNLMDEDVVAGDNYK